MKFTFNLKKRHAFLILALVAIAGFAIAQTPPNPGHGGNDIVVSGVAGYPTLTSWSNIIQTDVWSLLTRTTNLETAVNNINNVIGCPGGTYALGGFCIDMSTRGPSNWEAAIDGCRGSGMRLCSGVEWATACLTYQSLGGWFYTGPGGSGNWAGDLTGNTGAMAYGVSNTCTRAGTLSYTSGNVPYRCCKSR